MENSELEIRINRAVDFFRSGYNCSQSVFMAYSDLYDIDQETAAKLSTSFGGGMGRLREVCGAVTGLFLLLGLEYPFTNTSDKMAKDLNYKVVQKVAANFKSVMGSYICADLLKIKHTPQIPYSDERNEEYYKNRPCSKCVSVAAYLAGKEILTKNYFTQ